MVTSTAEQAPIEVIPRRLLKPIIKPTRPGWLSRPDVQAAVEQKFGMEPGTISGDLPNGLGDEVFEYLSKYPNAPTFLRNFRNNPPAPTALDIAFDNVSDIAGRVREAARTTAEHTVNLIQQTWVARRDREQLAIVRRKALQSQAQTLHQHKARLLFPELFLHTIPPQKPYSYDQRKTPGAEPQLGRNSREATHTTQRVD